MVYLNEMLNLLLVHHRIGAQDALDVLDVRLFVLTLLVENPHGVYKFLLSVAHGALFVDVVHEFREGHAVLVRLVRRFKKFAVAAVVLAGDEIHADRVAEPHELLLSEGLFLVLVVLREHRAVLVL